jgi:hypothetical protein
VAVTALVWLLLFSDGNYGGDSNYRFLGLMPVAVNFGVSLITMVGVSLLTQPPSAETLRKFFPEGAGFRAPLRESLAADSIDG